MGQRKRVAFMGAGRIADLHVLGYRDDPDAELAAVCTLDTESAQQRATEWGLEQWTTDPSVLFASPDIDVIEVLTPHDTHGRLTIAALEAGKHVLVQKPMAMNMKEADSMVEAAQRTRRILRVFETFRFYPPYVKAKELLAAGENGQTTAYHDIETDWGSSFDLCTRELTTALREGREPEVNPHEGAEILRFGLAAQLSAREGREVMLEEVPD
jgi:predicted dehydrogenase